MSPLQIKLSWHFPVRRTQIFRTTIKKTNDSSSGKLPEIIMFSTTVLLRNF